MYTQTVCVWGGQTRGAILPAAENSHRQLMKVHAILSVLREIWFVRVS